MISQFLAQRSDLFGCYRAGVVPPLATFVCENVRNLLVGQCLVPRLHYRGTEFLAFHGDWSLQNLHDNHGRPARAAGCKLRTGQRRTLPCHSDQPDGKRFATHTRLTFFPLHRGMDILDVSDFAVIHTLAGMRLRWWSAFVHLGGGCPPGAAEGEAAGDAAGAAPADLTSFNGCD